MTRTTRLILVAVLLQAVPLAPTQLRIGIYTTGTNPRLTQSSLTYVGAFRMPSAGADPNNFEYVGNISGVPAGLVYWPAHNSLILSANSIYGKTAEISIPAPLTGAMAGLNRATLLQSFTDVLDGKRLTVDGGSGSGVFIGGYYPTATHLIVSAFDYYDGSPYQENTHFRSSLDFSTATGNVTGPFQVNSTFANRGGFVSAWMLPIPSAYQSALGGPAFTGACCLSINARTSWGPTLTVFDPDDVGVTTPVPGTRVLGYDGSHHTVGDYDSPPGYIYNGAVTYGGAAFPTGTRTILFFGRVPTDPSNYCYGEATLNPALHRQPVPGEPGVIYCYDPTAGPTGGKGNSGYPYTSIAVAYDVNDLIAVKQGTHQWWEPVPYASWTVSLPYDFDATYFRAEARNITGVAYDPGTQRIFLLASFQDANAPIVHVFHVTP